MYYSQNEQTAAANKANAARAVAQIDRVIVTAVKGGWRYEAAMKDGSREMIRKLATREYALAHLHDCLVCSGKTGLGAIVNFGQKPTDHDSHVKTYAIVQK